MTWLENRFDISNRNMLPFCIYNKSRRHKREEGGRMRPWIASQIEINIFDFTNFTNKCMQIDEYMTLIDFSCSFFYFAVLFFVLRILRVFFLLVFGYHTKYWQWLQIYLIGFLSFFFRFFFYSAVLLFSSFANNIDSGSYGHNFWKRIRKFK